MYISLCFHVRFLQNEDDDDIEHSVQLVILTYAGSCTLSLDTTGTDVACIVHNVTYSVGYFFILMMYEVTCDDDIDFSTSLTFVAYCVYFTDCYAPAPIAGALSDDARLTSVCLPVAYIGPKSRTERPKKTEIGAEIGHVTRDSDTTFKVKRSKVNLQVTGAYCGGLWHSLLNSETKRLCVRQGGYVFIGISLFVCQITQKLLNRFSQNLVERWHIGHRKNCQ